MGVILTEPQVRARKAIKQDSLEAFVRDAKRKEEEMRMRRLFSCPFEHYLECW